MNTEEKFLNLKRIITQLGKAAVAFSGGVDSSFLSKVCYDVLGENALAVTIVSPLMPKSEIEDAKEIAKSIGIKHILIEENIIEDEIAENPPDRCYFCKKIKFSDIKEEALRNGIDAVLDGSNYDDLSDYRPGLIALNELKILSPLKKAELTKNEIRELSKKMNLKNWDKPACACLASRIPYGEKITYNKLKKIERSEDFLKQKGFKQFRVRSHDDTARIEVAPEEREKLFDTELMDTISKELKSYGFLFVSMDLEGYKTGSLNSILKRKSNE